MTTPHPHPAPAVDVRVLCAGVAVGLLTVALPLALFWLPPVTVYAVGLAVIAGIYVGFAVADGRPRVVVVEVVVACAFLLVSAAALGADGSVWIVAAGLLLHGVKDLWQHRTQFVRGMRWWPPFCVVVDTTTALALAALAVLT